MWGAGAVIEALVTAGIGPVSPEAGVARAAYRSIGRSPATALQAALAACASGRELIEDGYSEEIAVAAQVDVSRRVPVLKGDSFKAG